MMTTTMMTANISKMIKARFSKGFTRNISKANPRLTRRRLMSKKICEPSDPNRSRVQLEEDNFAKQRNIDLSLALSIFYSSIDVLSEELRQYFIALKTHKNDTIRKMKDGEIITKHGILKYKIFKRLFILDRILKTQYFQEIYDQNWKSFKLKTLNIFVRPGSTQDFHQRYYVIFEIISFLIMNEGVVPYPHEVQRFCDRYKALNTKTDLKKDKMFWKELVEIHKKKRQSK